MSEKKIKIIEQKAKNPARFWAWVLAGILIILATLFVIDKLRSNKKIKELDEENKKIAAEYMKYKAEHESIKSSYTDLESQYKSLNQKYNLLRDSSLLTSSEQQKELLKLQQIINKQDSVVKVINRVVKEAMFGFKDDELKVEIRSGKVYVTMLDKLLFKSGSAEVEKKGIDALQKLSKVLLNNPDLGIMVEGHTDNVPINTKQYQDNWDLSVARATSIVRILTTKYNLPSKRITAAGKGEFYPIASNQTDAGKAKNRRTEIILTPNLDGLYKLIDKSPSAK